MASTNGQNDEVTLVITYRKLRVGERIEAGDYVYCPSSAFPFTPLHYMLTTSVGITYTGNLGLDYYRVSMIERLVTADLEPRNENGERMLTAEL